jgi:hypothetical protein
MLNKFANLILRKKLFLRSKMQNKFKFMQGFRFNIKKFKKESHACLIKLQFTKIKLQFTDFIYTRLNFQYLKIIWAITEMFSLKLHIFYVMETVLLNTVFKICFLNSGWIMIKMIKLAIPKKVIYDLSECTRWQKSEFL